MQNFRKTFEDRLQEIDSYFELLNVIQNQVRLGPPRIGGPDGYVITVEQQRILYSSVYLQLYNLIESTVSQCIEAVSSFLIKRESRPKDLCDELRREWVRYSARTHIDLNFENRLKAALELCEHLIDSLPIVTFEIQKGGGGNWDDGEVENLAKRIGLQLKFEPAIYKNIKRPFRNEMGPISYVKTVRNDLAHGSVSFVECGSGSTISDLESLKDITAGYLNAVITAFETAIESLEFLAPEKR